MLRQIGSWIAFVLVLEGALYALFPDGMKRMLATVLAYPPEILRITGLVAAIIGVGVAWLCRA